MPDSSNGDDPPNSMSRARQEIVNEILRQSEVLTPMIREQMDRVTSLLQPYQQRTIRFLLSPEEERVEQIRRTFMTRTINTLGLERAIVDRSVESNSATEQAASEHCARIREVFDTYRRLVEEIPAVVPDISSTERLHLAKVQLEEPKVCERFRLKSYVIVELQNPAALRDEGIRMDNCLKSNLLYAAYLSRKMLRFFSLRSIEGDKSRATLAVTKTTNTFGEGRLTVTEVFGKKNSFVGKRFTPIIRAFMEKENITFYSHTRGGFASDK